MSSRKLGMIRPPKERRPEIFEAYTLDQVCEMLGGYLNGEITVHSNAKRSGNQRPRPKKKKKKSAPKAPLTPNEELIESIALIGYRVLLKYCNGQTPHPGRVIVWESGLKIADKLEADQVLPECKREERIIRGYHFHCRIYRTENMGELCIPEYPGEKATPETLDSVSRHNMPNRQWRVGKTQAAHIIMQNIGTRSHHFKEAREMTTLDVIKSRASYRGTYRNTAVPREDLTKIMEAGLAAPSGCNKQTTSLIAVDDMELLGRLNEVINIETVATAPAMICVLTQRTIAYRDRTFYIHDYSAAIENMLLAIVALGYESCWYEGQITDADAIGRKMADILGVPDDYELVCLLPVGVAEQPVTRPDKKPFDERAWFNGFQTQDSTP